MKDSLKNTFPLDGKKAYGLYFPENQFLLVRMKYLLENTFPLYSKTASSDKSLKMVSISRKIFFS